MRKGQRERLDSAGERAGKRRIDEPVTWRWTMANRENDSEGFEKLEIWKRSCRLSVRLYRVLRDCRDYGFKDQLTRAGLSVPSNIAEGYERGSNRDFIRFLWIAKGSCGEVRTQILIGIEAEFLPTADGTEMAAEARALSRMIGSFIQTRKNYEK
jgi:four helix bundle protein